MRTPASGSGRGGRWRARLRWPGTPHVAPGEGDGGPRSRIRDLSVSARAGRPREHLGRRTARCLGLLSGRGTARRAGVVDRFRRAGLI